MNDPKPGCWGHATTYDPMDDICIGCLHKDSCETSASEKRQRLEKLLSYRSEYTHVPTLITRESASETRRKAARESTVLTVLKESKVSKEKVETGVTSEAEPEKREERVERPSIEALSGMSKKAREIYERLARKGIDLKTALQRDDALELPQFLAIACQMLVADGKLDRKKLVAHYIEHLRWSYGTASSHGSIVWSLLTGLDIIGQDGSSLL